MKIKSLSTHNGQFHTDEVMAAAFLSLKSLVHTTTILIQGGGEGKYGQVTHIAWYVPQKQQWIVQVPTIKIGAFALAHPAMKLYVNAVFVHANGFLAA